MRLVIENQPRSPTLFVGDLEFADSPAKVNYNLFLWDGEWQTLPGSEGHHPSLIRVEVATEPQAASGGTRMLVPLRVWTTDGRLIYQPYYRSSGMATPESSPRGTWWPTSGLYTEAYIATRSRSSDPVKAGYIGKHFRYRGQWYPHYKSIDNLLRPHRDIAAWLDAAIPS
jgi:hypothetical protein